MTLDPSVQAAVISGGCLVVVAFIQIRGQRQQSKMSTKVSETHHQVTTNSHSSSEPTMLDRLDDVHRAVYEVQERLDRHLEWHAEEKPGKHRTT